MMRIPLLLLLFPLLAGCWPGVLVGGSCEYHPAEVVLLEVDEVAEDHVIARLVGPADSLLMQQSMDPDTPLMAFRPEGLAVAPGDRLQARSHLISKGSCVPLQLWLLE